LKRNTQIAAGAGVLSLGALIAITPRFLFSICEYNGIFMQLGNGKTAHMPCYYTALGSYVMGAMIGLIGITMILSKGRESIRMLSVVLGGAAIAVISTPVIFPICLNPDEPCNHGTKPMLIVLGVMTLMVSGWMVLSSRKSSGDFTSKPGEV
jgi:hypothetical protein